MNKITTTAGLLAISAVALQAQQFANTTSQKPWAVSATLRGFYDDNNLTLSDKDNRKEDTFGVEVSPSAGYNFQRDQTTLGFNYVYSMRWFEARQSGDIDHSHVFNAKLSHAFTERYKADVTDSFVISREPSVLDDRIVTVPIRGEGDALRNTARASLSMGATENLDIVAGYENNFWDFEEDGPGSRSATLDRVEHLFSLNFRQVLLPQTIGVLGYQYGITDYTSDQPIHTLPIFLPGGGTRILNSSIRDNTTHYFYAGVDQAINKQLNAAVRLGAQYTDYDNAARFGGTDSKWSPYADANLTWAYLEGSYLQVGVRHQRASTDVAYHPTSAVPTLDAEATTVYGSLSHKITAVLTASVIGQYQHTTFEGGAADSFADDYLGLGFSLTYDINKYLAAEFGYNYDKLSSELADVGLYSTREFDRNRVYVGVRATY